MAMLLSSFHSMFGAYLVFLHFLKCKTGSGSSCYRNFWGCFQYRRITDTGVSAPLPRCFASITQKST